MIRAAVTALLFLEATMACGNPVRSELVTRDATPFVVAAKPVTVTLDVAKARAKLLRAAKSPSATVVLAIEGVFADKPPGFLVAVFVGGERVGELALYALDKPQTVSFGADAALPTALGDGTTLQVRFQPESGLDGQPAQVEAPVRISGISLAIEKQ
jgi:hypothetical protein